jgi:hypothetical protein
VCVCVCVSAYIYRPCRRTQIVTSTSGTLPNDKHKDPLTPISRGHLKRMKVTQVVKITPGLHGSPMFLTSS